MKNERKTPFFWILFLCSLFLTGCANGQPAETVSPQEDYSVQSTYIEPMADSYDESLIVHVDTEESAIQFYNLEMCRTYTLQYSTSTGMKNRYGDELVAGQLECGDMVKITFFKDTKQLKSLQILSDVDVSTNVTDFEINSVARTMTLGADPYKVSKNAMVLSKGNLLELNEIHSSDTLKVVSKDHEILGITVENGHGYVRLSGQDSFIDGFVEIGQAIIKKVTPEMLLVVPEGDYTLYISKNGLFGSEEIAVKAGEETLVDVSKFEVTDEKKMGKIIFTISPSKAELYIDQEKTEYDEPVEMTCGIHQIRVKADGYKTLTQYIKVGQATANLNIELEESDGKDDEEEKENENASPVTDPSVSSNTIDVSEADGYRVYIDAPVSAELYVDGNYVGIIPTNFAKKEGTYVVSLRRDGYQTRSYTLQIDTSEKDVRYSFSDLTPK